MSKLVSSQVHNIQEAETLTEWKSQQNTGNALPTVHSIEISTSLKSTCFLLIFLTNSF